MKNLFLITISLLLSHSLFSQIVNNTSYINQANEKVLKLELVLPIDTKTAWKFFSTDEGLMKWIAPLAHIELKTGGYILSNYDKSKPLTDSSSIKLGVINFIENEMITLKVNLNNSFGEAKKSDSNLQEIFRLITLDKTHTKIISTMVGFGTGKEWDKAYNFFVKGNEWTFMELYKSCK